MAEFKKIDSLIEEFKSFAKGLAKLGRYGLVEKLNGLDNECAESVIRRTVIDLDAEEDYSALAAFVGRLKMAVANSNNGKGLEFNVLQPYGGSIEIPLSWQKNPKLCLGLKNRDNPVTFVAWTIDQSEQNKIKQDKKELTNKEKGAKRNTGDIRNEKNFQDVSFLAKHYMERFGYSKTRSLLEALSKEVNTNHELVVKALKGEVKPIVARKGVSKEITETSVNLTKSAK